jgi:hypothetical protein
MTLIAVRDFFDVAVLIGDTLVSSKASGKRRFPTQPPNRLLDSVSAPHGFLPSYTNRKVYIVSDNFAIGWAGDMWPAANLLERIYSIFAGCAVTLEAWENFITNQHLGSGADIVLIGWIIESGRKLAFRWRSKSPSIVEKDTSRGARFSEGSGADFAINTLGEPETYKTTATKGREKAILCALDGISELIVFELLDGGNLYKLFGLCYELIVFDGNRFTYIDNINYLNYHFTWHVDRPEKLEGGIVRFRNHYRLFDDYACCTISNHVYEPHFDGFFVIKPIFGEKSAEDWAPSTRLSQGFDADYFCNFVIVDGSDGKNMYRPFVVSRGSPDLPITYEVQGKENYVKMKEGHKFILQYYLEYRAQFE